MIEGQHGLDWPRWKRIVAEVEALGFSGLYRSDHFTNPAPPERDSLELWLSLGWMADNTRRLNFGPIVSPVTFRHPALSARMAAQVDLLAGGRLTLGLGAGWQEREHHMFGMDLLDPKARFDRFEEGLEVACRLLRDAAPTTFEGHYYQLRDAVIRPRPETPTRVLVGGNGEKRTLPLAARLADEWNGVMVSPSRFRALNAHLDQRLAESNRPVSAVRRSLMQGITYGADRAALDRALDWRGETWSSRATEAELKERGQIAGVADDVVPQIEAYEQAGVECLMLQWIDVDAIDSLRHLARTVDRWLR